MPKNTVETQTQIVVPIENKPGTLGEVTRVLAQANVNIEAIQLHSQSEYGILSFAVSEPAKAEKALRSKGFAFRTSEVLAISVPNKPGALAEISERLAKSGVNIESVTGTAPTGSSAEGTLLLSVDDIASARKVLG
jgi:hypothetical protein